MQRRTFLAGSALGLGLLSLNRSALAHSVAADPFTLPELPYPTDALEPFIDTKTMEIHHGKHHAGYTAKLNAALANSPALAASPIETIMSGLSNVEDAATKSALRNNGGGYFNHCLFWEIMAPPKETGKPSAELSKAIHDQFGSMEKFQETFNSAAASCFGSGWAWLIVRDGGLKVVSTPNQDNPLMKGIVADESLGTPILGVDVWEHAYYLKYQNMRADYLNAWWSVVNWSRVSENFAKA